MATFVLIIYGDAAFAVQVLEPEGITDVFAIVWGWGVAVMLGVVTAGGITGGHINPAVTFAFATLGKLPWIKVGVYIAAR
ncbi:aquaporin, partial [Staphylococcus aureus]|uniref:aquaporin n=1 Tax=Staphylococcus aureus TaxID=1280 RepID=UPI0038B3EC91